MIRLILSIAGIFLASYLNAQSLVVQMNRLDEGSGMPFAEINRSITDRNGFVWLASNDGLMRYDGYQYLIFRTEISDSTGFEGNRIWEILEDHEGMLWLITQNSLVRFNPDNFEIKRWKHTPDNFSSSSDADRRLLGIAEDSENRIWLSSSYGLFMLNKEREPELYFYSNKYPEFEYANHGRNLVCDTNNNVWISGYDGVFKYNSKNSAFEHYPMPENKNLIDRAITIWNDQIHVAGEYLYRFNMTKDGFEMVQNSYFGSGSCAQLLPDVSDPNLLWLAFRNAGLGSYNLTTGSFQQYNSSIYPDVLEPQYISGISCNDSEIWISTVRGMYTFNNNSGNFNKEIFNVGIGLPSSVYELYPDLTDSSAALSKATTDNGLYEWNRFVRSWLQIPYPKYNGRELKGINNWFNDTKGNVWLSVGYEGLYRCLNGNCDLILPDSLVEPGHRDYMWYIHEVAEDENGRIWVAADSKLAMVDGNDYVLFQPEAIIAKDGDTLMAVPSFSEILIRGEKIWLISEFSLQRHLTGVFCFDMNTRQFESFLSRKDFPAISNIHQMAADALGRIWLATENGIVRISQNGTTKIELLSAKDGLPSDLCEGIAADEVGDIWISTRAGLVHWSMNDEIRVFGKNSGLFSNNISSLIRAHSNGDLLLLSKRGLVHFDPLSIEARSEVKKVHITRLLINNGLIGKGSPIDIKQGLCLNWDQNLVSIYFSALDFHPQKETEYAYKLEGIDAEWIYTKTRNFVNYSNLRGGDYRFLVKAKKNGGTWSDPSQFAFRVKVAWFRSAWFFGSIVVLLLCLVYYFYNLRIRQLKALHKVRDRIASDLHDDVGSALSSLVIYSDLLNKETGNNPSQEKLIIKKLRDTASESMENMRDIVWSIQSQNDNFEIMLQRVRRLAYDLLESAGIELDFHSDPALDNLVLSIEQRRNVYLIIKEALNNARKYSNATSVHFRAELKLNQLHISIRDNGSGFDLNSVVSGNGLRNMKKRAEQLKAQLDVISVSGSGTSIILICPVHH